MPLQASLLTQLCSAVSYGAYATGGAAAIGHTSTQNLIARGSGCAAKTYAKSWVAAWAQRSPRCSPEPTSKQHHPAEPGGARVTRLPKGGTTSVSPVVQLFPRDLQRPV